MSVAHAQERPDAWLNQFGSAGLFQTPTARGLGRGAVGAGFAGAFPYRTFFVHAQPFDWLQGTFRFVRIRNIPNGPQGSPFTDKSGDIQIRLLKESDWFPRVAVGLIDVGGSSLLSSEYIVASRKVYNFDIHFGIGWGRLGSSADIDNPLGNIDGDFDERPEFEIGLGGTPTTSTWFRGPSAFFGGIVWRPKDGPLSLVVELEGNDYQSEPFDNNQDVDSRVNFGARYRWENLDFALSWQRGNELGFIVSTTTNLDREEKPVKPLRPTPSAVPSLASYQRMDTAPELSAAAVVRIQRELATQSVFVSAIHPDPEAGKVTVWYTEGLSNRLPLAAGRIARTLVRHTGVRFDTFELVAMMGGVETARMQVPREAFHKALDGELAPDAFAEYVNVTPARPSSGRSARHRGLVRYPAFDYSFSPVLRSNIGSTTEFFIYQFMANASASVQLTSRWNIVGGINVNLFDNIGDRLDFEAPTGLPPVRTELQRFIRTGKAYHIARLETNYIFPVAKDIYGRFSAGIFESMYGGVATEFLYRPSDRRWAVGIDVARVRKRGFKQRFSFQSFETTTGHLTFYYETPLDGVRLVASAGRYLARDEGVTIDLSKRFRSGVRVGVFATQTTASKEEFGEGSFDKGFYIDIPVGMFSPAGGKGNARFQMRPITRDGGAKVANGRPLYDSFDTSHSRSVRQADPREWFE